MIKLPPLLLTAALLPWALHAQAQPEHRPAFALGPSRAAGSLGLLALDGTRADGVGVAGAAQITLSTTEVRRLAIEAGFHTLSDPFLLEEPASPVWHARVLASRRLARSAPFYLTGGIGAYGPLGSARRAATLALGLDLGLGVRFSSRAAFEARYLNFRTTRFLGGAVGISLVAGL